MKREKGYEKIIDDLKSKEDYEFKDIWILMVVFLLFFGFNNCTGKEDSKTTININLKGSDVNV